MKSDSAPSCSLIASPLSDGLFSELQRRSLRQQSGLICHQVTDAAGGTGLAESLTDIFYNLGRGRLSSLGPTEDTGSPCVVG